MFVNLVVFFLGGGGLDHAQLPPVGDAPILCEMKGLMEIHKCGKFHEYTICGCQVINVQMFSDQQKVPFFLM